MKFLNISVLTEISLSPWSLLKLYEEISVISSWHSPITIASNITFHCHSPISIPSNITFHCHSLTLPNNSVFSEFLLCTRHSASETFLYSLSTCSVHSLWMLTSMYSQILNFWRECSYPHWTLPKPESHL